MQLRSISCNSSLHEAAVMCWAGLLTKNLIMKTELNKNDKLSTEQETPPISNVLLAEGFIIAKAYEIDLDKLDEGYLSDTISCHAENANEAKSKLLKIVRYDDWKLKYSGQELTYLNIPIKRRKSYDKVSFEGKEVLYFQIESIKDERNRISKLDEIQNNPNIKFCYIIKGSYYRPNHCGYTSLRFEAGIYPKDEAVSHAKSVREIRLEWIDTEEHNKMINEKIAELQGRLL